MAKLICKCCGNEARWCGEGPAACGTRGCDHIHCDHCGMHYSLESQAAKNAETHEEARAAMFVAYDPPPEPLSQGRQEAHARLAEENAALREALTELMTYTPRKVWRGGVENGSYEPTGAALAKALDKCDAALARNR